eukprot:966389-Rhodomonas_salina.3
MKALLSCTENFVPLARDSVAGHEPLNSDSSLLFPPLRRRVWLSLSPPAVETTVCKNSLSPVDHSPGVPWRVVLSCLETEEVSSAVQPIRDKSS